MPASGRSWTAHLCSLPRDTFTLASQPSCCRLKLLKKEIHSSVGFRCLLIGSGRRDYRRLPRVLRVAAHLGSSVLTRHGLRTHCHVVRLGPTSRQCGPLVSSEIANL